MDLQNKLKLNAQELEREIGLILKDWQSEVKEASANLLPLALEFIKSNKGGKKVRGFLVRLGYEIARSVILSETKDLKIKSRDSLQARNDNSQILKVAAAYEILHTSILAHDDIIDQSLIRRGAPSLYQALGGNHYGISQAICLADAGFFLAIKIISESEFKEKLKNQAVRLFSKTMVDTAVGQMMDVMLTQNEKLINLLKTARYTISGPLQLGATLGGAGEKLIRELGEFGENLGIAFQIKDDILDGEVESVDKAEAKALKYAFRAKRVIPKITSDAKMRKLFSEMVQYMVEREK